MKYNKIGKLVGHKCDEKSLKNERLAILVYLLNSKTEEIKDKKLKKDINTLISQICKEIK